MRRMGRMWELMLLLGIVVTFAEGIAQIRRKDLLEADVGTSYLGAAVSVSDGVLVTAGLGEDNFQGAVYVYNLSEDGKEWKYQEKLKSSDIEDGDQFGRSLAIQKKKLVVGASEKVRNGLSRGRAYVFEKDDNGRWKEVDTLQGPDRQDGNTFGYSVAVKEKWIFVYARQLNTPGSSDNRGGAVSVFKKGDNGWDRTQTIRGEKDFDEFGNQMVATKKKLFIAAPGANGGMGAVYVYGRVSGEYVFEQMLSDPALAVGDRFGTSLSKRKTLLVVGADRGAGERSDNQGAAYIFKKARSGEWNLLETLTASDGDAQDRFGYRSVTGPDFIAVSAWAQTDARTPTAFQSGIVYVFRQNLRGKWKESQKLRIPNPHTSDTFGVGMAYSQEWLAVGGPRMDSDANPNGIADTRRDNGAVQLFKVNKDAPNVLNFVPLPAEMPRWGDFDVGVEYRASKPAYIHVQIKAPGERDTLFQTKEDLPESEGLYKATVRNRGLDRGAFYEVHIKLKAQGTNKLLDKKKADFVQAVNPAN